MSIEREIGKLLLSHLKKYLLQVTNSCPQSSEICATESIKHLNQGSSAFSFWVFFFFLTIKVQRMIEKREEKKKVNIFDYQFYLSSIFRLGTLRQELSIPETQEVI